MAAPGTLQELARSHVQVLGKGTGGNTKFECIHCRKQFTGSLTRQLAHLTGTSGNGIALIVMQWLSLVIQMMSRYIYLFKVNPAYWIQFDTAMQ